MPAIRLPAWLRRGLEAGLFAGLLSLLTVVSYRWDRGAAIPAIRDDGEQREQPGEQPRLEAAAEPRGKANGRHRDDPRGRVRGRPPSQPGTCGRSPPRSGRRTRTR